MKRPISMLLLALISSGAMAQTADRALEQELTQKQGMTRIGEGLYASTADSVESYVAVGAVGQRALLEKLLELRAKMEPSGSAAASPRAGTKMIDDMIAELSQPVLGTANENYGDCSGRNSSGPFHATASSGGAVGADASASNSDASINTTNQAYAYVTDGNDEIVREQTTTTYGTATAWASATSPNPNRPANLCRAGANSSVTCPGQTTPAIRAFAFSSVYPPRACL